MTMTSPSSLEVEGMVLAGQSAQDHVPTFQSVKPLDIFGAETTDRDTALAGG